MVQTNNAQLSDEELAVKHKNLTSVQRVLLIIYAVLLVAAVAVWILIVDDPTNFLLPITMGSSMIAGGSALYILQVNKKAVEAEQAKRKS